MISRKDIEKKKDSEKGYDFRTTENRLKLKMQCLNQLT